MSGTGETDTGFADRSGAARRLAQTRALTRYVDEERRASIVRRQAELLAELLDHQSELDRVRQVSFGEVSFLERLKRAANAIKQVIVGHRDERLHDGLLRDDKASDVRLRLAESIFELQYAINLDHPDLPSLDALYREGADHALRLSENAE